MLAFLKTVLVYVWAPVANLLWYTHTVVMGSLSLLLWPFDRTGEMQFWCSRWWCRLVAWSIFARIRVHGVEHVRAGQPYVYMANHSSLIDTPALFAYLPYPFRIMAKRELFLVPFMGWHLWTAGHFPIDRRNARKTIRSVRRVIDGVRGGASLALFPEGTRTRDGRLQEFRSGAFKIALKAGVPIVPVTIRGTFALLPKTTLAPRPGRVDVILGTPIDTRAYDERRLPELIARTRNVIEQTLSGGPPDGGSSACASSG
ncbi:MAG: lysophospholipid acyltransferase family protein [Vicinamibacterales bacterium]|jgi:1-acyl-sn-glycerol-3-phosphate acyltransferase|nr:lysophospholipid acyltransferase family protein [Vicinamibacterales bacterium]